MPHTSPAIAAMQKLAQLVQVPHQTPPQTTPENPHPLGGNPETLPPKSASWSHHTSILGGDAVSNGLYEAFEPGDLCCKPDTIKAEMPEVFEFNRLTTKSAADAFWRRVLPQPTDQQRHQAQAVCGSALTHKTAAVAPPQYQNPVPVPGQPSPQPAIPGQTPGAGVPQPGAAVSQPPPVPGSPSNPVVAGGGLPQAPQAPGLATAGATPTGGASPVAPGHPTMTGVAQRPIGLDRPQDTRAAALPGVPGHAATNVIDQQGGLDPRGLTVDGNNAAGIKKLAAACGVSTDNTQTTQVSKARILQALGMPSDFAVNKNQKQAGLVDATVSGLGAGLGAGAGYAFNAGPLGGALGGAAGGGIAGAGLGAGAGLLSAALSDRDEEGNKPWLRRAMQGAGVGGVAGAGLGGTVGAGIGALGKLVRTMAPGAKWVPPSQRTPEVEQLPTLPTEYDDARLNEYFRQLKEKKKPGAATPNAPTDRTTGRMSPAVNGFIQNLLQGSGQKQAAAGNVVGTPQFATTGLLRAITAVNKNQLQKQAFGRPELWAGVGLGAGTGALTTALSDPDAEGRKPWLSNMLTGGLYGGLAGSLYDGSPELLTGVGLGAGAGALTAAFSDPDAKGRKPWLSNTITGGLYGGLAGKVWGTASRIAAEEKQRAEAYKPTPAVPKIPATPLPKGLVVDTANHEINVAAKDPAGFPKPGVQASHTLGDNIERYYGGRAGLNKAIADAQAAQAGREPNTLLDAFQKWKAEDVDRKIPTTYVSQQGLGPHKAGLTQAEWQADSARNTPGNIRVGIGDGKSKATMNANLEHELTHALTASRISLGTPLSRVHPPKDPAANRAWLDYATTTSELDPRIAGIKRVYTKLTGEQVNTPEAADRALRFATNPQLSAFNTKPTPPVRFRNGAANADYYKRKLEYDKKLREWSNTRSPALQLKDHIEGSTLKYINETPAVRDTVIRRMLELVNRGQGEPQFATTGLLRAITAVNKNQLQKQSGLLDHVRAVTGRVKRAFGSPGMAAGMAEASKLKPTPYPAPKAAIPKPPYKYVPASDVVKQPAPVAPKSVPAAPAAAQQGRLLETAKGAPPPAPVGTTVRATLGDNIERYYGGRPGLDKAIADAQGWQAKREPGTTLDAFPKWRPDAVDRPVPMTFEQPTSSTMGEYFAANVPNRLNQETPGQRDAISIAAPGKFKPAVAVEHELTHALTGANGNRTPFSRIYPPKTSEPGLLFGDQYLDYATTPVELDPRLAGVKRLYTQLTGEDVNTPEAAARALDFAAKPQLGAFSAVKPVKPETQSVGDVLNRLYGKPTEYDKQLQKYESDIQNGVLPRPPEQQLRDHMDPPVINYINETPAVRDTAIRRMLELVQGHGQGSTTKQAGILDSISNHVERKRRATGEYQGPALPPGADQFDAPTDTTKGQMSPAVDGFIQQLMGKKGSAEKAAVKAARPMSLPKGTTPVDGGYAMHAESPSQYVDNMNKVDEEEGKQFADTMHNLSHAYNQHTSPWYSPYKINSNVIEPVANLLNAIGAPSAAAYTGLTTGNPLLGAGVGAGAGLLTALPSMYTNYRDRQTLHDKLLPHMEEQESVDAATKYAPTSGLSDLAYGTLPAAAAGGASGLFAALSSLLNGPGRAPRRRPSSILTDGRSVDQLDAYHANDGKSFDAMRAELEAKLSRQWKPTDTTPVIQPGQTSPTYSPEAANKKFMEYLGGSSK